jgi:adenylate cyclase class IV
MTNFEFKARVRDFAAVHEVLGKRRAHFAGILEQIDTYFHAPRGRLKLREIRRHSPAEHKVGVEFQLIFYQRADKAAIRRSDYSIVPLDHADDLRELLATALGIHLVIRKSRELFLLGYKGGAADENGIHIRIHLDRVEELGEFVEVEALAGGDISAVQAAQEAQALLEEFGIPQGDLMTGAYADLLAEKRATVFNLTF